MKILVLGAGGIGGYFGGRLVENGQDVTFLVRDKRHEQLAKVGLKIDSLYGNATLRVHSILKAQLKPEYDVILLACKAYDLDSAVEVVAPALRSSSVILPLLNGIEHIETLNARFGSQRVLGGTVKIAATLTDDGTVRHLNDWRFITLGEQTGELSERARAIAGAFPAQSVVAKAVDSILQEMWEKFVHLATAASLTCLMRASVGEIVRSPDGAILFSNLLNLSANVARVNGYPPSPDFLENYRRLFSDAGSTYTTSMLRDIEAGNQIEADHIVGYMLTKARQARLPAHTLEMAFTHLKAYQARREDGRLSLSSM